VQFSSALHQEPEIWHSSAHFGCTAIHKGIWLVHSDNCFIVLHAGL